MEKQLSMMTYSQGSLSLFSKLEKNWSWGNIFLIFLMAYGLLRFAVDAVRMLRWLCSRSPIEKKSELEMVKTKELEKVKTQELAKFKAYFSANGAKFHLTRTCTGLNKANAHGVVERSLCLTCQKCSLEWSKVE